MLQCSRATLRKLALIGCINRPVLVDIPWCRDCDVTTGQRRTHNRHSRDGGNPHRGARRWVPVSTGTTVGGGRTHNHHSRDGGSPHRGPAMGSRLHRNDGRRRRTHNRHSRDGGNPQRGAGDGFPSPPKRRWAAAHPQSSFPRRRGSTEGGRVPLGGSEQVPRRAGPRAASNVRYNDERRHRPPVDATAARGPDARWIDAAGGATDVSELR